MSKITMDEIFDDAKKTYNSRNDTYKESYAKFGHIMKALFPSGLQCATTNDFIKLGLLVQIVSKLTRHSEAMKAGVYHPDSLHDLGIYSFMLEMVERNLHGKEE